MNRPLFSINKIILHHSLTPKNLPVEAQLESFERTHAARLHKEKNGLGLHIAYHYIIGGKGEIKITRPVEEVGYHAGNWGVNLTSVGICLCGNFDNEIPNYVQINSLIKLLDGLKTSLNIKDNNIFPHRKYANKSCPGIKLTDTMIAGILSKSIDKAIYCKDGLVKINSIETLRKLTEDRIVRIGQEIYKI